MNFASVLQRIMPVLSPFLLNVWSSDVMPALQKEIAKLSADEQVAANAFLVALDTIAKAEIPKI